MNMVTDHSPSKRWFSPKGFLLLLAVALVAGLATAPLWKSYVSAQSGNRTGDEAAVRHAHGLSQAFRVAANRALPTVVQVASHTKARTIRRGQGELPFREGENPFKGTPFEDFFKDGGRLEQFNPRQTPRQGQASGVIIDRSGVILTNNHVVDGADEVIIRLHDGREYKATKIRRDKQTDLALVWIDPEGDLPAAKLGDSDSMQTGDWVLAIGHPFHFESTVSAGIISGKGRALRTVERANFLQTDAAINPGNSGGPLVNLAGEVVGINTAIYTGTGAFAGIGFAVPVNTAKWVASELMQHETVRRAYLGVGISKIGPELADQLGVRAGQGVLVSEVRSGTPAEGAGLHDGDVILTFAGQKVSTPRALQIIVERSPLGSRQPMVIIRDGKQMTLHVQLDALPQNLTNIRTGDDVLGSGEPKAFTSEELGIEVSDMSDQVAQRLGYEGFAGALISRVDRSSLAYRKGLREGMLVLKVANTRVRNVEEFEAAMKNQSIDDGILLQVRTPQGNRFLVLKKL